MSKATTVKEYLAELSPDVRKTISQVRDVILKNLPKGYQEHIGWGMICYSVPLERYPNTYNQQPLSYVALAAQKNYRSLYYTGGYMSKTHDDRVRQAFKAAGKKLDMGKACIRFKTADDLPLEALGQMIGEWPVEKLIKQYETVRGGK